ncbi:HU family DNA-binding protein [Prevotella histicola]|jgi:integration host factor IHF alpha subunit|uniref:HU family DNA-binding protein n=1 Tax=Prevotella histicola TaxID=470565 RepID=UPI001C5F2DE2|nr:HU family DNA-binding protein [Prevotella histicola]MBW4776681.1 HU family DNA-binding protein [Prevotella histicola]
MAKSVIQIIATAIAKKHNISIAYASSFVEAFFMVIGDELKRGNQVKVKGLGTFKVQTVKPRESVNVNTGERVLIKGHDKISFTPDASMKELVNKPFSQFETVVINDNVNVEELETLPEEELSDTVEQADQDFEDTISKSSVVENSFTAAMDNSIDEDNDSPNTFNTQSVNGVKRTQENNTSQKEVVEKDSSIYSKSQETLCSTKDKYVDTPNVTTSGEALSDIDDTDDDIESSSNSILRVIAFLAAIIIVFLGVFLWMKVGNEKNNKVELSLQQKKLVKKDTTVSVAKASVPDTLKHVASRVKKVEYFMHMNNDARIRYGAYNIVGIDRIVVLKKGQTMAKYSRQTLGADMIGYFQVLNGRNTMAEGDTMKVPRVELRPQYRKK